MISVTALIVVRNSQMAGLGWLGWLVAFMLVLRVVYYGKGSWSRFGTARPNTILFVAQLVSAGAYGPPAPLK